MPHSYTKILIHAIWSTKDRIPLIHLNIEKNIHHLMSEEFKALGCPVIIINGMPEHVHCLFLLSPQKSISEVIKQVKGGTSHHINQNNIIPEKFAWQTGYAAYSVSESVKDKVYSYIKNQKVHHHIKSFSEEYDEIIKIFGSED